MEIVTLEEIKQRVNYTQIIKDQEEGFVAYSKGRANIPMPGYLKHNQSNGSYHIKYGYIEGDKHWVVKIAGGPHHLPINGMMMAINTSSGQPEIILQDQGYLTGLRTAVAGLVAAKYLANKTIQAIGIIGTGLQARLQVELLSHFTECKRIVVWGRSKDKVNHYQDNMRAKGYEVICVDSTEAVAKQCNLIITATASESALLTIDMIQPGTHISAVGADSPGKMELDPTLIANCDRLIVDSKTQCLDHGESCHAVNQGLIQETHLIELGEVIDDPTLGRQTPEQITVADLTGLAVQDIQIVKSILK